MCVLGFQNPLLGAELRPALSISEPVQKRLKLVSPHMPKLALLW